MTYNVKRAARMKVLSEQELKKRVETGSLSAAAARYELRRRGVEYTPKRV